MKAYDLIIFDCDGTLVNTEIITTDLLLEMITNLGFKMDRSIYESKFVGSNMYLILDYVEAALGSPIDRQGFENSYRKQLYKVLADKTPPIDGMLELVKNMNHAKCIASNGPLEKMAVSVEAAGYMPYFDRSTIFSAYQIQKWKPDPALFLYAMEQMGYSRDRCLVIEDSIHGVEAARAGGIDVCCVNLQHNVDQVNRLGAPIFENGHDLAKFIYEDVKVAAIEK